MRGERDFDSVKFFDLVEFDIDVLLLFSKEGALSSITGFFTVSLASGDEINPAANIWSSEHVAYFFSREIFLFRGKAD